MFVFYLEYSVHSLSRSLSNSLYWHECYENYVAKESTKQNKKYSS